MIRVFKLACGQAGAYKEAPGRIRGGQRVDPGMEKILVIDDDDEFREVVCDALRQKGYEVLAAGDGDQGVELARAHLPDLIISDVHMGRRDGYGVLAALREEPTTAAVPFILMTGLADAAGMRRGMEQGADDYLAKPFSLAGLFATVQARLKKQASIRQQAEKQLAQLRASISLMLPHELNTPLVGILGLAEIIGTSAQSLSPAELKEFAQTIVTSGERLRRLIQNFLLHARLELLRADPAEVKSLREHGAAEARDCVAEAARKQAASAGRLPDLSLELEAATVAMSPEFLAKVVEELVGNAFKFSAAGTPVRVAAGPAGGAWRLAVSDRGRGMKPEEVAEIGAYVQFERHFYEQQGSGLGLFLAKRLAELHGGRLWVESQPAEGTLVGVELPLAAA
jgi:signal transduction histidine kinase